MSPQSLHSLRRLEGRHVAVALRDGTHIDDCELISAGRRGNASLWLHDGEDDRIVQAADVADLWEVV